MSSFLKSTATVLCLLLPLARAHAEAFPKEATPEKSVDAAVMNYRHKMLCDIQAQIIAMSPGDDLAEAVLKERRSLTRAEAAEIAGMAQAETNCRRVAAPTS